VWITSTVDMDDRARHDKRLTHRDGSEVELAQRPRFGGDAKSLTCCTITNH
jgi:hypothetical protein